jgi:hypothetical protein
MHATMQSDLPDLCCSKDCHAYLQVKTRLAIWWVEHDKVLLQLVDCAFPGAS